MTARPTTPPLVRMCGRALVLRCPLCGARGVFRGWFTMEERCPQCRLRFERIEGHWLGSLGTNTIVSFASLFVVLLAGVVLTWPDIPVVPLSAVGVAVAVAVPLAFFPCSRTLWTAVDLAMRPPTADEADFSQVE